MLDHLDPTIIRKEQIAAGRIFISYSRRNRDFARTLYTKLEGMGFSLWRDVHDIEAGAEDWWQSIQQAIRECETMILCMSLPALKSAVVGDEWAYAREQKKRIIPVVADDIWDHPEVKDGTFTIPNWMQRKNWLDFRSTAPEAGAAWANLIRTLNETYVGKRFINMADELPPRFVRRVEAIDHAVRGLVDDKNDAVAMTTALNGAGGYGKTTLAKAIARDVRIQGAFDDGILWITLGEKLLELSGDALNRALIDRVGDLIYALTETHPAITTLEMARTELRTAIGDLYILLVIDDVWDKAHLAPFLVKPAHAACLITTRSLDTVDRKDILKQTVDKMKSIEAVELLGAGFDADELMQNDADLRALARELREYPLVLALANTQIASYAHDMSLSLAESIDLANETLRELGVLGFDDTTSTDRNAAVSKTLDLSIQQVTPAGRQRMYRELAIFPEDALIPLVVLEKYWGLSKVGTLQFCQTLYRKTALLHSFEGMAIRIHDVFRDCLVRAWDADQLRALHCRLTDSWGVTPGAVVTSLPASYCWKNLAYHLIQGGQADVLRPLLLDYRYLRSKIGATDANALQADCDALLTLGKDEPIRVLRSAISMSAHVLREDPNALGHQLVGRLMGHRKRNDELCAFTDAIPTHQPGLYPLDFDSEYVTHEQAGGYLWRTLVDHSNSVRGALELQNGNLLSWSRGTVFDLKEPDTALRLWTAEGILLQSLEGHTDWINGAVELADGRILSFSDDARLRLWTPEFVLLAVLSNHTGKVRGVKILADRRLISWDDGGKLRLWTSAGTPVAVLEGHAREVGGVQDLPDGRILSWGADGTLRLWTSEGTPLAVLKGHTNRINGAVVLNDGRFLSWSWDTTLRLWTSEGTP